LFFQSVDKRVEEFVQWRKSRDYTLGPIVKVSIEEIEEFERKWSVKLPKQYAEFLVRVGCGAGVLPEFADFKKG
jgi:hypothetical protein